MRTCADADLRDKRDFVDGVAVLGDFSEFFLDRMYRMNGICFLATEGTEDSENFTARMNADDDGWFLPRSTQRRAEREAHEAPSTGRDRFFGLYEPLWLTATMQICLDMTVLRIYAEKI